MSARHAESVIVAGYGPRCEPEAVGLVWSTSGEGEHKESALTTLRICPGCSVLGLTVYAIDPATLKSRELLSLDTSDDKPELWLALTGNMERDALADALIELGAKLASRQS